MLGTGSVTEVFLMTVSHELMFTWMEINFKNKKKSIRLGKENSYEILVNFYIQNVLY